MNTLCKFSPNCNRKDCKFVHANQAASSVMPKNEIKQIIKLENKTNKFLNKARGTPIVDIPKPLPVATSTIVKLPEPVKVPNMTASSAKEEPYVSHYITKIIDPANPVDGYHIPDDNMTPHVLKTTTSTCPFTIPAATTNVIVLSYPNSVGGAFAYVYTQQAGGFNFNSSCMEADVMNKSYVSARLVSSVLRICNSTITGLNTQLSGTINSVIAPEGLSFLSGTANNGISYNSIVGSVNNVTDKVIDVPACVGVTILSKPVIGNQYQRLTDPNVVVDNASTITYSSTSNIRDENSVVAYANTFSSTGLSFPNATSYYLNPRFSVDVFDTATFSGTLIIKTPTSVQPTFFIVVTAQPCDPFTNVIGTSITAFSGAVSGANSQITVPFNQEIWNRLLTNTSGPVCSIQLSVSIMNNGGSTLTGCSMTMSTYTRSIKTAEVQGVLMPNVTVINGVLPGSILSINRIANYEAVPNAALAPEVKMDNGYYFPELMDYVLELSGSNGGFGLPQVWDTSAYNKAKPQLMNLAIVNKSVSYASMPPQMRAFNWSALGNFVKTKIWPIAKRVISEVSPAAGSVLNAGSILFDAFKDFKKMTAMSGPGLIPIYVENSNPILTDTVVLFPALGSIQVAGETYIDSGSLYAVLRGRHAKTVDKTIAGKATVYGWSKTDNLLNLTGEYTIIPVILQDNHIRYVPMSTYTPLSDRSCELALAIASKTRGRFAHAVTGVFAPNGSLEVMNDAIIKAKHTITMMQGISLMGPNKLCDLPVFTLEQALTAPKERLICYTYHHDKVKAQTQLPPYSLSSSQRYCSIQTDQYFQQTRMSMLTNTVYWICGNCACDTTKSLGLNTMTMSGSVVCPMTCNFCQNFTDQTGVVVDRNLQDQIVYLPIIPIVRPDSPKMQFDTYKRIGTELWSCSACDQVNPFPKSICDSCDGNVAKSKTCPFDKDGIEKQVPDFDPIYDFHLVKPLNLPVNDRKTWNWKTFALDTKYKLWVCCSCNHLNTFESSVCEHCYIDVANHLVKNYLDAERTVPSFGKVVLPITPSKMSDLKNGTVPILSTIKSIINMTNSNAASSNVQWIRETLVVSHDGLVVKTKNIKDKQLAYRTMSVQLNNLRDQAVNFSCFSSPCDDLRLSYNIGGVMYKLRFVSENKPPVAFNISQAPVMDFTVDDIKPRIQAVIKAVAPFVNAKGSLILYDHGLCDAKNKYLDNLVCFADNISMPNVHPSNTLVLPNCEKDGADYMMAVFATIICINSFFKKEKITIVTSDKAVANVRNIFLAFGYKQVELISKLSVDVENKFDLNQYNI